MENGTYSFLKDEVYEKAADNLNSAHNALIADLNSQEGMDGVIEYLNGFADEEFEGFYADKEMNYPQYPAMMRMHIKDNIFDYIFYPENGKYNGEYDKYLFLGGKVLSEDA